jgi:hypothetical protein
MQTRLWTDGSARIQSDCCLSVENSPLTLNSCSSDWSDHYTPMILKLIITTLPFPYSEFNLDSLSIEVVQRSDHVSVSLLILYSGSKECLADER